jgi:uncharacterized protein (DUF2235 family)
MRSFGTVLFITSMGRRETKQSVDSHFQLKNDDQRLYYQPGVGTYVDPGIRGSIEKWFAKVADLAFAWYLDAHVMGGYEFLMNNHLPGDTVVMFGWS